MVFNIILQTEFSYYIDYIYLGKRVLVFIKRSPGKCTTTSCSTEHNNYCDCYKWLFTRGKTWTSKGVILHYIAERENHTSVLSTNIPLIEWKVRCVAYKCLFATINSSTCFVVIVVHVYQRAYLYIYFSKHDEAWGWWMRTSSLVFFCLWISVDTCLLKLPNSARRISVRGSKGVRNHKSKCTETDNTIVFI